jgi:Family of unknown function (DUF5994)
MTSAPTVPDSTTDRQRLSLKPDVPSTGFVDGAWWPASRDLAAELPALAAELAPRLGRIESVSYHLGAWDTVPRRIDIDGAAVRLAGYRTQDHDTVDVISGRRRLTLLVVPPETDPQAAQDALAAAGRDGNADGIEKLLRSGAPEPALSS